MSNPKQGVKIVLHEYHVAGNEFEAALAAAPDGSTPPKADYPLVRASVRVFLQRGVFEGIETTSNLPGLVAHMRSLLEWLETYPGASPQYGPMKSLSTSCNWPPHQLSASGAIRDRYLVGGLGQPCGHETGYLG